MMNSPLEEPSQSMQSIADDQPTESVNTQIRREIAKFPNMGELKQRSVRFKKRFHICKYLFPNFDFRGHTGSMFRILDFF